MNRAEMTLNVLKLEAVAKQLTARAKAVRAELDADARAELAEHGTAVTWRLPEIGTWSQPVSKDAVVITDRAAFVEWTKERWPDEITDQIKPAFEAAMKSWLEPVGEIVVFERTGEIVPGLSVQAGGQAGTLQFRPAGDALAVLDQVVGVLVTQLTAGLGITDAPG